MTDTGAREIWEQRWLLPGELREGLGEELARRPPGGPATSPAPEGSPAPEAAPARGPEPAPARGRAHRRTGRDWTVDVLLFLWAAGMWLLMVATLPDRDYLPAWMTAIDAPLGALGCLALWWRRRFPLLLAVALVPVGALTSAVFGALTVVILNLGLRTSWRTGAAVLAAHVTAALPYMLLYGVPHEGGWASVAFVVAHYLFFFSWGAGLRLRRQLVIRLREDARRERAEHARRLADARRTEREAIAREMHDVLAHRMSLLSVHAGALAYRTRASAPATPLSASEISDSAQLIRDTAHQALEELRDVLTVLRGTGATDGGPQPEISDIGRLVADATGAGQRVTLSTGYDEAAVEGLRGQVRRTAYRVVQEGLTNARKHAPGRPVTVSVTGAPGHGLTVAVRNELAPGVVPGGAGEIPGAGAGLAGLEERAALDGGSLSHGVTGTAFHLVAELPWGPAEP
ncbi:histidine kinase [Streptomyces sp. SBT349]|uniref:histidine kinase n=1 Tax=Streptomyces sp. SBT349 TaxID=1580539 RepID=UPI00066AD310|nr:histidine kinase [Streptomyces sp. SBT349]